LLDENLFVTHGSSYYSLNNDGITLLRDDNRAWTTMPPIITLDSGTYRIFTTETTSRIQLRDSNNNVIGESDWPSMTFTLNSTTAIKIKILAKSGLSCPVFIGHVQIERGSTATDYTPYKPSIEYPIPAEIQALDGYGWSAGTVYNYVDFAEKKFHKRVGRVDLGTLTWTYDAGNKWFYTQLDTAPPVRSGGVEILNAVYERQNGNDLTANQNLNGITLSDYSIGPDRLIIIRDLAYTDATAFKNALSGVYLYYELAVEEVIDISNYLTDDNFIETEVGGTITLHQQDELQLQLPNKVTYMVRLEDTI